MKETHNKYGGILPAGGKGRRLLSITGDEIPKSLMRVGGKELIRYSTDALGPDHVNRLVFAVDYKADQIRDWVLKSSFPHIVQFSKQTSPGVLGAISDGSSFIEEDEMIACNTDEVRVGLELEKVINFHERSGRLATMVATNANRLYRHRLLQVKEDDGLVLSTRLKPEEYVNTPDTIGLVNTGFLILSKKAVEYFDPRHGTDWGGIIDPLTDAGQLGAYVNTEIVYFNVGTPEEFEEAESVLS